MKKHFFDQVLNHLNCISSMAAMENAGRTQREIINLTDYIRFRLGSKNAIIKLKDELKAVNNLIALYQSRLGTNLRYTENIGNDAKELYFPKHTIMAFVENSLFHAFGSKEGVWEIWLRVLKEDKCYIIEIEDNGEGFTGFEPFMDGRVPDSSISAVIRNLNDYYGSQQEFLSITSNQQGTRVRIGILQ
ncbi:sensor histidine kinase [Sporomusa aerivorans]|uniref:sensor histidine kinase n=1 Tax=Sporomusa aerivorans TaxID=204936 RepID=UPI00352B1370